MNFNKEQKMCLRKLYLIYGNMVPWLFGEVAKVDGDYRRVFDRWWIEHVMGYDEVEMLKQKRISFVDITPYLEIIMEE